MSVLDEILGTAFIGCLLTAIFYGVTCLQTILYFIHCKTDGKVMKGLVSIVVVLDTLHMALVSHYGYTSRQPRTESLVITELNPSESHE